MKTRDLMLHLKEEAAVWFQIIVSIQQCNFIASRSGLSVDARNLDFCEILQFFKTVLKQIKLNSTVRQVASERHLPMTPALDIL